MKIYSLVIRPGSPHVRRTVDQPCKVQTANISEDNLCDKGQVQLLTPQIVRNHYGQNKAKCQFQGNKIFLMELYDRILQDIRHVNLTTTSQNLRVFVHHQPANMGKEKSAIRIVRIGIGLRVFMVNAMIANPVIQSVL